MKKLLFFIAVFFAFVITSCGGSSGYNAETCAELKNKIDNKETLTEKDYDQMIDQTMAIAKFMEDKTKEFENDPEKLKEFKQEPQIKEMEGYAIGFVLYLSFHENELPEATKNKLHQNK